MTGTEVVPPLGLVTWFHADSSAHAGLYPQVRGSSATTSTYEVYLGCVDLCVASFRRWNPDGPCAVVLNPQGGEVISAERRERWRLLDVDIVIVENHHWPDVDLFDSWQNQFFLFDVLRAALEIGDDPRQPIIVVDSDIVVRGPLHGLAAEIVDRGRVSMRIPYPEHEVANGVSRLELADFVRARGGKTDFVPAYQGGEFIGGTRSALTELSDLCEEVYAWSLALRGTGEPHPNEEAHMISVADPMPESAVTGNAWIERVWTKPWKLRLVPDDANAIPIWHVPAEKKSGIPRLRAATLQPGSWFWLAPAARWQARVSQILGVPRYGPQKLLQDLVALRADVIPALQDRIRR